MAYKIEARICGNTKCLKTFDTKERSRFCCRSCAQSQLNRGKLRSESQRKSTSASLKKFYALNPKRRLDHIAAVKQGAASSRGRFKRDPTSILELSKRTVTKILKRLNVGCSFPGCGWNECVCDVHHIDGRKIPNADIHEHLTYLCPNHHRMVHSGKIEKSQLVNLKDFLGDRWKLAYYG